MDVLERLEEVIEETGGVRRAAQHLGFSPAYISSVRSGQAKSSPRLAEALGFEVVPARLIWRGKQ